MKVEELKPYQKKVNILVKVVSKGEPKEVQSRWDASMHKMSEVLVGDETGCVLLTLWDDSLQGIEEEKTYQIENAYTTLFKGSLRLNIGRFGTLTPAAQEIANVNTENKLSKEIEEDLSKEVEEKRSEAKEETEKEQAE